MTDNGPMNLGSSKTVWWQGVDDPRRIDRASFVIDPRSSEPLAAEGESRTPDYHLTWQLDTGEGYLTRRLQVSLEGSDGTRRLDLRRDENAVWTADSGAGPSIVEAVAGADDCDLGLCPATNSMPMLRSILPPAGTVTDEQGPEHRFLMAWVHVPSLQVLPSGQLYRLLSSSADGFRVRYTGEHRDFTGELTVDADGVVIDYQQLARRIPAPE